MEAIIKVLRDKGFNTETNEIYNRIDEWKSWYDGYVKGFHTFRVNTGVKQVKCKRRGLGMAKKVCEDWADLMMNEKVTIVLGREREQKFWDAVCKANAFRVKANEMQEKKAAIGTTAYVPRVIGATLSHDGAIKGKSIVIDYVTGDNIYPLSWCNGIATECAFASNVVAGKEKYVYLQIHKLEDDGLYAIENSLYKFNSNSLQPVPLSTLKQFENVPEKIKTNSDRPLFVLDRMNIANNVDSSTPMGISVFANAIDNLEGCDIAYDSYVNEFVLGKKRIMVKPEFAKTLDGDLAFDPDDVVFYILPEDANGETTIKEIDMTLRTEEHSKGIQDMLNVLSSKVGFGEHHYSFEGGALKTATEVVSQNSTLFRTLKKHELILNDVLIDLVHVVLKTANLFMGAGFDEDVEVTIDFDDSVIEDTDTEFERDIRMVNLGSMNLWEFRAKWAAETEEEAKANLPQMEGLVSE